MYPLTQSLGSEFDSDLSHSRTNLDSVLDFNMEDDELSVIDSPAELAELSNFDKQRNSLQTYLDAIPYQCESIEEMQDKLEGIVEKIYICAKSKNWLVLSTWDGMLQCWLLMRYPMEKSTRAKLVRVYYELCLLPGVEPRVLRNWADMVSRLLSNKPGLKRKLESSDLELPWQSMWRVLQRELWPKTSLDDASRNLVNILLYVVDQCKRYFPVREIPLMLETFLPRLTKETVLTMVPVLTSFLPPGNIELYLPTLFKIWEGFNSATIDDRLLELCGDLSEEHVTGNFNDGGVEWQDIGIWTESQWEFIVSKGLGSLNVPVGAMKGASNTSHHADLLSKSSLRIKKSINRLHAFAKILVYSMRVDGEVRETTPQNTRIRGPKLPLPKGYTAGSKALDTLDRLITSIESFFHPSNTGQYTLGLTNLLQRLTSEFAKRLKEEEQDTCVTPITHRLTPSIRKSFVSILRTPALLAMFAKDPVSMSFAQGALRLLALLEPNMVMPELLDRAYGGLEVVNETHRTTAVLSMLSGIARPLVREQLWLGGQKHVIPLLELCIPGIDLNDPVKTVCATMFIVAAVQHIKIGDLSQSGSAFSGDEPPDEVMDINDDSVHLPDGTEYGKGPTLSRADERSLVRDSTASFADWVVSLFRRVFALYENLPEEGGKKNTTGGKQEEGVLKSIKGMLDVVCLHLSDPLFDLVLNLVYDYATSNAKSNAVRAFGQLIACLARVRPEKTIAKFLPYCISQIEEELKHGASSVRTTSTHLALPSDTTLHWNISILRGCLGYGGVALVLHKRPIIKLLKLLVEKTKSERGFTSTGRLITRILNTIGSVYPYNSRFVNSEDWNDPKFDQNHNLHWGRLYEPQDVVVEWHMPTNEEIAFVMEIIDELGEPTLNMVERLINNDTKWDNVSRNDFCRCLHACRAIWLGLPTFIKEQPKKVSAPCQYDKFELPGLLISHLDVQAGFVLTDPADPRYQKVASRRQRFAEVVLNAAVKLAATGEDHIDAVLGITRAIDTYLNTYAMSRSEFDSLQKNYAQARDLNRSWIRQKDNSRMVFIKRAHVYHGGRMYMHSLYRRRSLLDDKLITELINFSISPYTRIRRQAQGVLFTVSGTYVRSTRFMLPGFYKVLERGNDPDAMKGALYVLWNKGIAAYALADQGFHKGYLLTLLNAQHEEKPSIQKLVASLSQDAVGHLSEEGVNTDAYSLDTSRVDQALEDLEDEFSEDFLDEDLLGKACESSVVRAQHRQKLWRETVDSVLAVGLKPTTHWRYVQVAVRFLNALVRRDAPIPLQVAKFLFDQVTSPQPTLRQSAQRAVSKILSFIKMRTYSKTAEDIWLDEWRNPFAQDIEVRDPTSFLNTLWNEPTTQGCYVDKLRTGFLSWTQKVRGCRLATDDPPAPWEAASSETLRVIQESVQSPLFVTTISALWSQESNRSSSGLSTTLDVRAENINLFKALSKIFRGEGLDATLEAIDSLVFDADKYKQRAGAEMMSGLIRGSKHWPLAASAKLWEWLGVRLDRLLAQVKPETLSFWETIFSYILARRDPRRSKPIVDWILTLSLDFSGESAFEMTKPLTLFAILIDSTGVFFHPHIPKYLQALFNGCSIGYAELRQHICQGFYIVTANRWHPWYPSTEALLAACANELDPLHIRDAWYMGHIQEIVDNFPKWREGRLAPPYVAQSEYDKVGLTLLQWIWVAAHGPLAGLIFPYAVALMPEFLRMSELSDNPELQTYSSAVLYILSAATPPKEYIQVTLGNYVDAVKSSTSWRIRLNALPPLVVFFYRNLLSISQEDAAKVMDVLLECLADENVEVREMASKMFSGVVRCSQRQNIIPLKNRFVELARKTTIPPRRDPAYADSLRKLHSAILGLCGLIESLPYSVESWMPPLTEVLAPHATDPPPISTTIRKCASEFKKTHQDTWHKDQLLFDEDQLQSLSTMLVGTSYYA